MVFCVMIFPVCFLPDCTVVSFEYNRRFFRKYDVRIKYFQKIFIRLVFPGFCVYIEWYEKNFSGIKYVYDPNYHFAETEK